MFRFTYTSTISPTDLPLMVPKDENLEENLDLSIMFIKKQMRTITHSRTAALNPGNLQPIKQKNQFSFGDWENWNYHRTLTLIHISTKLP